MCPNNAHLCFPEYDDDHLAHWIGTLLGFW